MGSEEKEGCDEESSRIAVWWMRGVWKEDRVVIRYEE